mmetsp:Transcript_18874/g.31849  ORF Transcript_18874/g.31849 Transcript_18874/m.31849 type:complete len:589 (-) Transcript_18874:319-2085(-)
MSSVDLLKLLTSKPLDDLHRELELLAGSKKAESKAKQTNRTRSKIPQPYKIRDEYVKLCGTVYPIHRVFVRDQPVGWVLNEDMDQCINCRNQFGSSTVFSLIGYMTVKHHCRSCGNIVCSNCCEIVGEGKHCSLCYWGQDEAGDNLTTARSAPEVAVLTKTQVKKLEESYGSFVQEARKSRESRSNASSISSARYSDYHRSSARIRHSLDKKLSSSNGSSRTSHGSSTGTRSRSAHRQHGHGQCHLAADADSPPRSHLDGGGHNIGGGQKKIKPPLHPTSRSGSNVSLLSLSQQQQPPKQPQQQQQREEEDGSTTVVTASLSASLSGSSSFDEFAGTTPPPSTPSSTPSYHHHHHHHQAQHRRRVSGGGGSISSKGSLQQPPQLQPNYHRCARSSYSTGTGSSLGDDTSTLMEEASVMTPGVRFKEENEWMGEEEEEDSASVVTATSTFVHSIAVIKPFVLDRSTRKHVHGGHYSSSSKGQAMLGPESVAFLSELSVSSFERKYIKETAQETPDCLVGWQVLLMDTHQKSPLGLGVITGWRKNLLHQSEYRISTLQSPDCWVKLRRSAKQQGTEFIPLRPVLKSVQQS